MRKALLIFGSVLLVALLALVPGLGLLGLLAAFALVYLGARAATLSAGARGTAWMITGAAR